MAQGAKIEIIGADGSRWVVSGPGMGEQGVELDVKPEGLINEAPIKQIWQQSAFQEGATYMGTSIEPIDLVLGFHVWDYIDDNGKTHTWEEVERKFFRAFHERKKAQIAYTANNGKTRTLDVIKMESITTESDHDPRLNEYSKVVVALRAPFPYWRGETQRQDVKIEPGEAIAKFTLDNPTDTYMWPKWTMTAPGMWIIPDYDLEEIPDVKVANRSIIDLVSELIKVDDDNLPNFVKVLALLNKKHERAVRTPILFPGQDLTIDTYPRNETYVAANGSNIAGRMQGVDFLHPVPPGVGPVEVTAGLLRAFDKGGLIRYEAVEYWKRPY